ncbi:hypothetical protein BMI86_10255 [Thioclava sp. DLFJ5-1]|uniref:portal protein n=1 Tax=Thioclava sp. DLFJ5-1 TaxID=1915314 RepID=UPI000995F1DF|nr:hypothetical protein [Thioclava sp. DLFJ5-1]OOY20879.1 hypothetical protein BMI86_10255 [Thioclava sp. DLFJ5-1]
MPLDLDFSGGAILSPKGKRYRRPGEVMFTRDGATRAHKRQTLPFDSAEDGKQHPFTHLDGARAMALHRRLIAIYRYELERQTDNRAQMSIDEDMYDHIQWTAEEIAELEARGQAALQFNLVQTTINWVLGSQRRAETDYKVLPRRKDGLKSAERKSELLRFLRDENDSAQEESLAFADAVKVGIGWLETGQGNAADGPLVFDRHESWRNMLWDSRAKKADLRDARYVARVKWLDHDIACAKWPDRQGLLSMSTEDAILTGTISDLGDDAMDAPEIDTTFGAMEVTSGGFDVRKRIRTIEMWFRMPVSVPVMSGGDFSREIFDPWSKGHWTELMEGRATLVERVREVVHYALMTEKGLLDVRQSPYRHNRFPFTPIWGYRRGRDGLPYGMIRGLRDIQRDLNKRASKALHALSTVRVTAEDGAVDDIEELREEAGRPDSVIVYKTGHPAPKIETDRQVADAHINLMSMDAQMIQQVGGVTDENMGRTTNATSGKAIVARQDQGQLATSLFFDNLRSAKRLHGTKKLINVEQFFTERMEFRITNARGNPDYVTINGGVLGDAIDMFKADFIIAEEDWRATTRQAQAAQLMELMQNLASTSPQIVIKTVDLLVESLDVPKRDEIVKRIRQITGVSDPDEDPNNPSPETQAAQAAAKEAQDMAKRTAEAELSKKEADAQKARADAARNWMGLRTDNVEQLMGAVKVAIELGGADAIGAAVDGIMKTSTDESIAMASAVLQDHPDQATGGMHLPEGTNAQPGQPQHVQINGPTGPEPHTPGPEVNVADMPQGAGTPAPTQTINA